MAKLTAYLMWCASCVGERSDVLKYKSGTDSLIWSSQGQLINQWCDIQQICGICGKHGYRRLYVVVRC